MKMISFLIIPLDKQSCLLVLNNQGSLWSGIIDSLYDHSMIFGNHLPLVVKTMSAHVQG